MKLLGNIAPLPEAVKKLDAKSIVLSKLRSSDWADVPIALRNRSKFSARMENARYMSTVQSKLSDAIRVKREALETGKEAFVDRGSFIGDLRALAFGEGLSTGTERLTDPASRARLGLIYDMQVQSAQGFARFKSGQDSDSLDQYPAQELYRLEGREHPRGDSGGDQFSASSGYGGTHWPNKWRSNGGQFFEDGRMIALKSDPIWTRISRFGTPWPPFDYGSGMWVEDVSRAEAERLGLLTPGQAVSPDDIDFNDDLEASAEGIEPGLLDWLIKSFGDQIEISGGKVRWTGKAEA